MTEEDSGFLLYYVQQNDFEQIQSKIHLINKHKKRWYHLEGV